jgi:hypothetical protein
MAKAETILEMDTDAIAARAQAVAKETDDSIIERLQTRFGILNQMTLAVKEGIVRSMIISGPPGVGKSHGVLKILEKADLLNTLAERPPKYEVVKGSVSAVGLYAKLYEFSDEGNVLVFDDADGVFFDETSLNLLKAALDTTDRRFINWNKDSRLLRSDGIPNRYEFKGSVIFITNINFSYVRSKKLRDHLDALKSRSHYIDLGMESDREKILWIYNIVQGGMLDRYGFSNTEDVATELMNFIVDNQEQMRELSLRVVLKLADLRKSFPAAWQNMAKVTLMHRT